MNIFQKTILKESKRMLKIKDSVDMKILEEYGFKYQKGFTPARDDNGKIIKYHKIKPNGEETKKEYTKYIECEGVYSYTIEYEFSKYTYYVDEKDRTIYFMTDNEDIPNDNITDFDILYFLIKDDLIEQI